MKDSNGFTGGFTQIKNLTEEQMDEIAHKIIPIDKNDWDMFLDLMFNVKQNRGD